MSAAAAACAHDCQASSSSWCGKRTHPCFSANNGCVTGLTCNKPPALTAAAAIHSSRCEMPCYSAHGSAFPHSSCSATAMTSVVPLQTAPVPLPMHVQQCRSTVCQRLHVAISSVGFRTLADAKTGTRRVQSTVPFWSFEMRKLLFSRQKLR